MKYRLASPVIDENQIVAVSEVLRSKQLVHGDKCHLFEKKLGEYLGIDSNLVAVTSSCTASLHLALLALGIGVGDGVLVPNFTFPATVNTVEIVGAIPIFIDVNRSDYVIHIDQVEEMYTKMISLVNIKAIIVVHEFGYPVDMAAINAFSKKYDLKVIEDAACAFGSTYNHNKVGLLSDIGCFSFHPRKALTTGEGGAVVSRNLEIINKVKVLRNHGMELIDGNIDFVMPGLNYRMTNFQGVLGIEQLKYFNEWVDLRRKLQLVYREHLKSDYIAHPKDDEGHTWQSYMVVLDDRINRNQVIADLKVNDIESNYGAYSVISTTYYSKKYGELYSEMKQSERLFRQGLCLPLHQALVEDDIIAICKILNDIIGKYLR